MRRICAAALLLVFLLSGCRPVPSAPQGEESCTLTFITIGKGDAFLLTTAAGRHFLIDTGKAEDFPQIARLLRLKGVETLEGIFLSHGHKDHTGSLDPVLERFPTGTLFFSDADTVSFHEFNDGARAEARGAELRRLAASETLEVDGLKIQCWHPETPVPENENNNSLILRITCGDVRFLLMGDAELEEEAALMASGFPVEADLLKLGHHGEADASSDVFLRKVKPRYGLITGNEAENPDSVNAIVAERMKKRGIRPFYSESCGLALDFHTDGRSLTWDTVEDPESPAAHSISLADVDRKHQRVTIRNTGSQPADLSGCTLFSQRGGEAFCFPGQTCLPPEGTVAVACRGYERAGDLLWDAEDVWKKKDDAALLFDPDFILLDIHTD